MESSVRRSRMRGTIWADVCRWMESALGSERLFFIAFLAALTIFRKAVFLAGFFGPWTIFSSFALSFYAEASFPLIFFFFNPIPSFVLAFMAFVTVQPLLFS